jgi:DNA repair protein RecO (recombination protein O)
MSSRARTFQTEGIVLRHQDLGEADRLLWIYTLKMGKIRALAKGIRKIRSRKAGHLEPFTRANLILARGRDFFIVTQAETIEAFLNIRDNLLRIGYAAYAVELIDRFTYEEDGNQGIYRLLIETLSRLNTPDEPSLPIRYYEIHLLDLLGYRPQLINCVNCESEIKPENQYFSASQGGVLCPKCGSKAQDAQSISLNALKYLRHFQRNSFDAASRARLSPELNHKLESLLQQYYTYFLERNLYTPTFLRRIRN